VDVGKLQEAAGMFDNPLERGCANFNECLLIPYEPWLLPIFLQESKTFPNDIVPGLRVRM